ncbi:MAG: O-antigen ligase family protein [Opitutae bacterium]|nr:O-antigen ligase family protein [Opitutae bacterium]
MNPRLRNGLVIGAAIVVAVAAGIDVANENYGWIGLLSFAAIAAALTRTLALPVDVIVLGLVMLGYLVGNRGFAQLMPMRTVPLLPAEGALLVAGGWAFIACAYEKRLPFRRNLLNWLVLAWLALGCARVLFDVRQFGFLALRDFAMCYYAAFFFLAQRAGEHPGARRYLIACALLGCALLPTLAALYEVVPRIFYELRIHGTPVLLYKGDLALMFTACAAVLLFHWALRSGRTWLLLYPVALGVFVFARESRASILGLALVLGLLALHRRWAFPAVMAGTLAAGAAIILILATVTNNDWAEQRIDTVSAHLDSIVNPLRSVGAVSDESAYKWDNNRFRLVWWKSVMQETLKRSPVIGLGFGYDLAQGFLQAYNPEMADDFTARSPHNVALTALGRLGLAGLAVWLGIVGCVLGETWRSLHLDPVPLHWGVWGMITIILITAHLQVVLEGPMGAVPFWIMLGIASGSMRSFRPAQDASPGSGTTATQSAP